jgi:tRNA-binding protein
MSSAASSLSYADFDKVDIRVGRIVDVQDFPEARKPAFKLKIDFGSELGIRRSSAQVTKYYSKDQLLDRLVLAVVNFPPKQIGPFISEVLTLGVPDGEGAVVLLAPERLVPLGARMF